MHKNKSISTENFIKAVYQLSQPGMPSLKTGTLAQFLNITPAATTEMTQKLARQKLLHYEKYKPVTLSSKGKKLALQVIRRHRLWETFLHQVLGLSLHEIHEEAEMLEHLSSDFLTDKISAYLEHPLTDPHGDPIPDAQGTIHSTTSLLPISRAKAGNTLTIARITGSNKDFFDFCRTHNLLPGKECIILHQHATGLTEIKHGRNKLLLPLELTGQIFVYAH